MEATVATKSNHTLLKKVIFFIFLVSVHNCARASGGSGVKTNSSVLTATTLHQIVAKLIVKEPARKNAIALFGTLLNDPNDYSLDIKPVFDNIDQIEATIEKSELTFNISTVSGITIADLTKQFGKPQQPPLGTHGERSLIFRQTSGKNVCRVVVQIPTQGNTAQAKIESLAVQCEYNIL